MRLKTPVSARLMEASFAVRESCVGGPEELWVRRYLHPSLQGDVGSRSPSDKGFLGCLKHKSFKRFRNSSAQRVIHSTRHSHTTTPILSARWMRQRRRILMLSSPSSAALLELPHKRYLDDAAVKISRLT